MFTLLESCVGGCAAPAAKLGAAKAADSATNKGRVSRAAAFATYVRSPRTLAPAGAAPPAAPIIVRVEGVSATEVAVYFSLPVGAMASALSYAATAYPGGASQIGTTSPIVVGGLEPDTDYWMTVRVLRADGSTAVSAWSNAVATMVL